MQLIQRQNDLNWFGETPAQKENVGYLRLYIDFCEGV